jgi:hypothetical protein
MRSTSRILTISAALLVIGSTAVQAQRPQTRQGFWIGFGLGWGSLGVSCGTPDCRTGRTGAASGYLKLGGTLSPHFLLGGETNGWTKEEERTTVTAANASLAAYYYPQPAGGLFLKGGAGIATFKEEGGDAASGVGLVVGLGYDFRVGPNVSITPVANFNWGRVGDVTGPIDVTPDVKQNIIQLAVGVTFH